MEFKFKFCNDFEKTPRLDKYLSSQLQDFSRGQIQFLIKNSHVKVNGIITNDSSYKLKSNTDILLDYDEAYFHHISIEPENISLNIVYEDNEIIVINKPAGLVVHPAPGNYDKTLVNALMYHTNGKLAAGLNDDALINFRPGIVHRIDKETSGILVVAKTTQSLINLQKQFERHAIHRIYHALCFGKPKLLSSRIETSIAYNAKTKKQIVQKIYSNKKIRTAITNYETIKMFDLNKKYISLIKCKLETGRTHQIRVHMSHIGNPVIGDKIYGNNLKQILSYDSNIQITLNKVTRHLLHASELGFNHPTTNKWLIFKSDLPDDMQYIINLYKDNITYE